MAGFPHRGALLTGFAGCLALASVLAGEARVATLTGDPQAAMTTFKPHAASAERGGREPLCIPMPGRAAGQSGLTPGVDPVAGGSAAGNAGYLAMHRHATQALPIAWEHVQTCAMQ